MTQTSPATNETYSGRTLGFTIPSRDSRGRIVRLDGVLDEILSAHEYPAPITHLLAEALVLATLMGSLLKDDGSQVTMQAQTEAGAVNLLVCDYRGGELRGYVDFDEARLSELGANPSLFALFGKGYLAITFDVAKGRGRYQGIVPLEGETLAEACETYFYQSEQVPTLIRTAVRSEGDNCLAAGMLVQHLPDGEEGRERLHARLDHPEWEHVAILGGSVKYDELVDPELSLEAIIWRLFHEEDEVRIERMATTEKGCRCSVEHYVDVLSKFPEADRQEMRDENGIIMVDCAFCSRKFPIEA
ncbi:Hsp33 family molecular chaperone HslO [Qipengyuania aquimaris]|uniref:Hsp33 family molecular chaperone HslO n=1 Tax=Qipengyuania aquimaris TaxID=255984 RepID=A0A9Q3XDN8_9SPHN|nr:Hsp33 family molecular chaperone HslO [Qipengyuania aquimaris]MBY6219277.1 Hsp33 family molecular chaperone HslO [Qipengyuania aquimaris]